MSTTAESALGPGHIVLRGPGAAVWNDTAAAINYGIEPPLERIWRGRAGTGKSFGVLGALVGIAELWRALPGRVLILRSTRHSLTTSACATMRKILDPRHPALEGARDDHRTAYWINSWEFALSGLDNIANLLSSEWDYIFCDEVRQFSKEHWEELQRGLRNHVFFKHDMFGNRVAPGQGVSRIPFGQMLGCTNPWALKTWFEVRAKQPGTPLVLESTSLLDNPAYADEVRHEDGTITIEINLEGTTYDRRMRATTSGTRFRRLVLGEPCSAEGMIYEEWQGDPDTINQIDSNLVRLKRDAEGWVEEAELKRLDVREFYAGIDFGDAAPGAFLLAAFTGARDLIVIAELYARRKDPEWWRDWIVRLNKRYPITQAFCDHNRPDMVRLFNDCVGAPREGPGAVFVNADKGIDRGIALVRMRIKHRTLRFDVDALAHPPDPLCLEDHIPYQTVDEIPEYTHARDDDGDDVPTGEKREERPDKRCHDHGCDAKRYLVVGVDTYDPEKKRARPINKDRAAYLRGLYAIPVIGFEDENALQADLADMQDEDADWLADEANRMFRRGGGDVDAS